LGIALLIFGCGNAISGPPTADTIKTTPPQIGYDGEGTISIDLEIVGASEIESIDITLTYDSDILEYREDSAEESDKYLYDLFMVNDKPESNELTCAIIAELGTTIDGDGKLARSITFDVKQDPVGSAIGFKEALIHNEHGSPSPATTEGTSICSEEFSKVDLNDDHEVDMGDLFAITKSGYWGCYPGCEPGYEDFDLNTDEAVDMGDLFAVTKSGHWGDTCP